MKNMLIKHLVIHKFISKKHNYQCGNTEVILTLRIQQRSPLRLLNIINIVLTPL